MSGTTLLSYGNTTADQVYTAITAQGVSAYDARFIAVHWLYDNVWNTGRSFAYSQPVAATDAACAPAPFRRSFDHVDWVDGESTVQAGATPGGDEGFNARLHKVEADLDALGALSAQGFSCVNGLRASLSRALDEIRAELNRLNADIAQLKRGTGNGPVIGPIVKGPRLVGTVNFAGQQRLAWELASGEVLTVPQAVKSVADAVVNPATRAPGVAEVLAGNDDIRRDFGGAVKVRDLLDKYGNRLTSDGRPLSDLLGSLAPDESFTDLDAVVTRLTEMDASLAKGLGTAAGVRQQLGQTTGDLGTVQVGRFEGLPSGLADALDAQGVKTLKDLSQLDAGKLSGIAASKGITLNTGSAGAILARARTVIRL
ncbi:hypothetical protein [Roseomonas sp. BN140053]|uniref:hypothetical protein n=1 Tax=Roseomonas sp. BN140053 TaxID=3391898 RepID=UPI0039E878BF